MIFPFFALYITQKFNVGMTQAGVLLAIFSVAGLVGSMIGGALTDKFGRRGMVIFGLVFSALSSVSMGLVNELSHFYLLAIVVGSLSNIAGPAHQVMVADILPEEKRTEGFGMLRVAANLSWIFGPMIGGLVAGRSYLMLFILDAITSLIVALIVFRLIPETKPQESEAEQKKTLAQTFVGYRVVLADRLYLVYLLVSMLMLIAYQQMYHTLSVYLRDSHGIPARGYGALLSIDAALVVLLQFWITRRVRSRPPMIMMAAGTALYMVGLAMFGFVSTYWLFVAAILLLTFGEMIVMPLSQSLAARFAPEDIARPLHGLLLPCLGNPFNHRPVGSWSDLGQLQSRLGLVCGWDRLCDRCNRLSSTPRERTETFRCDSCRKKLSGLVQVNTSVDNT